MEFLNGTLLKQTANEILDSRIEETAAGLRPGYTKILRIIAEENATLVSLPRLKYMDITNNNCFLNYWSLLMFYHKANRRLQNFSKTLESIHTKAQCANRKIHNIEGTCFEAACRMIWKLTDAPQLPALLRE